MCRNSDKSNTERRFSYESTENKLEDGILGILKGMEDMKQIGKYADIVCEFSNSKASICRMACSSVDRMEEEEKREKGVTEYRGV